MDRSHGSAARKRALRLLALCVVAVTGTTLSAISLSNGSRATLVPANAPELVRECLSLKVSAGPPPEFHKRTKSDRYEAGTDTTLIINATIWTGARGGTEVVRGDVLLQNGIVKALGYIPPSADAAIADAKRAGALKIVHANEGWVTPGLVDLHSHVGLLSAPAMSGTFDVNTKWGPVLPWLRSIDGFNTHDDSLRLAMAGGVTSVQALPGSGNAIGGQAFMMKIRPTNDRSPSSMVIEPPHTLNESHPVIDADHPPRWRHMKQACGENLKSYGTRMDSAWAFRHAYDEARKVRDAQDAFCTAVEQKSWSSVIAAGGKMPESLQWEMLVDVLRGRVKISNHCYEPVDLDNIIRLTQEFKFPIAAFHHASGAYLVPERLKQTWGGTPAIAIFATKHRYKREAYRGSEFAPRVLADSGIPVVMKTDHPVIQARDILQEAQQAHYFGLPAHLALASVTATPATAAGLSHRIGILREGSDADVVLWDTHPLRLGATPRRVWADGILQIPVSELKGGEGEIPVGIGKQGHKWQHAPRAPNWGAERKKAIEHLGLPPLTGRKMEGKVVFKNVREVWTRSNGGIKELFVSPTREADQDELTPAELATAVIYNGRLLCAESGENACDSHLGRDIIVVDLKGGSIVPGLMTFGSPMGLEEITQEVSTRNTDIYNGFAGDLPEVLGDVVGVLKAKDGLLFATRHALTAYRAGITLAASSIAKTTLFGGAQNIIGGLSVVFRTGSAHALEPGAIIQDIAALHMSIGHPSAYLVRVAQMGHTHLPITSVSTQIGALRRLLLKKCDNDTETGYWFGKVAMGDIPLVIEVSSADIMTTLIQVKAETEAALGSRIRMVFSGASEAHLLAPTLAKANVGVILANPRPFPGSWDERRILPGPPLTEDTAISSLVRHGVLVGVGVRESEDARNMFTDVAWASLASNGRLSRSQALAMSSINLETLLGIYIRDEDSDMVAFESGNIWDLEGKPIAVISPRMGHIELF